MFIKALQIMLKKDSARQPKQLKDLPIGKNKKK